ncbi:MAG: energy-coupling factor transporter transmembrane protein EcfT [Lachnospiraceae bacterium]|nr:energy-coupling factor transporter transmembrane protein EcfT [Lachnospiraceae bacterium]
MLRDITLGQYYPAESVVHRLDPRVKFFGTILYIVTLFLFKSFWGFIPVVLMLAMVVGLSKIPPKFIFKGLKPMLFLLIFMVIVNLLMTKGEVVFEWWKISISKEGIRTAGFMALRLILLVTGSSVMTYTTTPTALTAAIERAFAPLKLFKFPVHDVAMMMSIALRFIPILLEETDKIMKAQQARGADFENGGLIKRAKAMLPILVPLFVSAFRRAGDLAQAMEARCYHGGEGRTKLHPLKYAKRDLAAFAVLAGYLAVIIIMP